MNNRITINDTNAIKDSKALEQKEREIMLSVICKNPGENSADELFNSIILNNLLMLCNEYYENGEYSVGYKLGMNAAETFSQLYHGVGPIKFFLIKEAEKISSTKSVQIEGQTEELKKTTIIIDEIMQELSKLLLCEGFLHTIDVTCGDDESEIFIKKFHLKQHSTTIPNPDQIPSAYKTLLNNDAKTIYRVYTNFMHYFAGNWNIAIKRLGKIKKGFNDLHKLCPFIRLSMVKEVTSAMQLDDFELLPEDIKKSLFLVDPNSILFFHASFIMNKINQGISNNATFEKASNELKKIAEVLANPLKDVIQLNIIIERTIKCMLLMKSLQASSSLSTTQQQMLQNIERFFDATSKQKNVSVADILAISYKIAGPLIENIKKRKVEMSSSKAETSHVLSM